MSFIEVKNLRKQFKKTLAVDDVSFGVKQGEIFGLLGPNGAGKSTTIFMIAGLLSPTAGELFLKGENITGRPVKIKEILGLVPQEIALYPTLTAKENLEFWGKMYGIRGRLLKQRVEEALEYAGLTERAKERIETFSGGMKRRINIAAALLHHPELLIMDEPTVGIDPQSRNHILETVKRLNHEGMTVIYTSHYMEEVEYLCDRIAIMDYGRIIAMGTSAELKQLVGDSDRVEIKVKSFTPDVLKRIGAMAGVEDVSAADDTITVLVKGGRMKLAAILEILADTRSEVQSVDIQEPNLESVFLHLTGRALRD